MVQPQAPSTRPSRSIAQVITGVAVMLAWFAVAIAATVYWVAQQSKEAGGCGEPICLSNQAEALIAAFFIGIPVGGVGLVAASALLALLGQRIRSGWLVGTIAAVAGLLVGVVVVVGGLLLWSRITKAFGW